MPRDLTFDIVDDLVAAHSRGKLVLPSGGNHFAPTFIAPLVELSFSTPKNPGVLLDSSWLDTVTHADFRSALRSSQSIWTGNTSRSGFMRSVFDPLNAEHDVPRTRFFMAARRAAEIAGLPVSTARYMTAALRELESNIHEHSGGYEGGLLAFQASKNFFEFIAADNGVGVLATLRDAGQFANLSDHGQALYSTLQDGVSRQGHDPNHGNGFRDLFLGLRDLEANLRFRSGDHALTISGSHSSLQNAELAQKTFFQGFLASVRCYPRRGDALH